MNDVFLLILLFDSRMRFYFLSISSYFYDELLINLLLLEHKICRDIFLEKQKVQISTMNKYGRLTSFKLKKTLNNYWHSPVLVPLTNRQG